MPVTHVEEVKAAVESGLPTTSTWTALRDLLGLDVDQASQGLNKVTNAERNGQTPKTTSVRKPTAAVAKSRRPAPVTIREHTSKAISGREKYALATHVVNHSLKLLASSLKAQTRIQNATTSSASENAQSISESTPQRALQPRSANISPVRASPEKPSIDAARSIQPQQISADTVSHKALAVAKCGQLGFSFLLNADFQALGVRELPRWQLETGLLALVASLISHGLDDLALKQLRVVKERFEAQLGNVKSVKAIKPGRSHSTQPNRETLATLLCPKASFDSDPTALAIANTYQQHALRLISRSSDPRVLDDLPKYVAIDVPDGPVDLIMRQAKATKDFDKAGKQLQALAHTIICLGPSVASAEDELARDAQRSPPPDAMLRLQTIGLQIRKLWWKLAKHQADIGLELLEPFLKCVTAFVRRQDLDRVKMNVSGLLESCLESIGPFDNTIHGRNLFHIHNIMCSQAETDGKIQEAWKWAEEMAQDCAALDQTQARVIAILVRKAALLVQVLSAERETCLAAATDSLQSKIAGTSAEYDILVDAIKSLSTSMYKRRKQVADSPNLIKLLILSATFCQQYACAYPGRNTQKVIPIIEEALCHSHTTEDLLAWVTQDSARVLVQAGALQHVVKIAATRPLLEAWSASREGRSLSRIVNALLLKALRSSTDSTATFMFDDEKLSSAERGVLLEWQLQSGADLASRVKYHGALKKLLPELLRRLAKCYDASEFPIRRIRVATTAFGIREAHPSLIPPHLFKVWQDVPIAKSTELSQDSDLAGYYDDLVARCAASKLFSEGKPTAEELRPHLATWQQVLGSCGDIQALHDHCFDPASLQQQLSSIATYLRMQGEDGAALPVFHLLVQLVQLIHPHAAEARVAQLRLAENYLRLGCCSRVATLLRQSEPAEEQAETPDLTMLEHKILYAEYLFDVDKLEQCASVLDRFRAAQLHLPHEAVHREQRRTYESFHARSWLLQSRIFLATGSPQGSLRAAKRAVQLLNTIWSSIERSNGLQGPKTSMESTFDDDKALSGLAQGISKLQLLPSEDQNRTADEPGNKRGAAFWEVMPVLMKTLLHLSDVYAHHGLFNEADYYSQRAVNGAESVESSVLLSRVRSHRCRLLTLAGKTEEAELCVAHDEHVDLSSVSLAHVDRQCAKAVLKLKEGSLSDALELYEKADQALDRMISEDHLAKLEGCDIVDGRLGTEVATVVLSSRSAPQNETLTQTTSIIVKGPARKPGSKPKREAERSNHLASSPNEAAVVAKSNPNYVLQKVKNNITVESALIQLRVGKDCDGISRSLSVTPWRTLRTFRSKLWHHHTLVQQATEMLHANVTLSLLMESTLALPGLTMLDCRQSEPKKKAPPKASSKSVVKAVRGGAKTASELGERPESLLLTARGCFSKDQAAISTLCSTSEAHLAQSNTSNVSLLASAIVGRQADKLISPADEALRLDLPRIKALQLEKGSVVVDSEPNDDSRQSTKPETHDSDLTSMAGSEYQEQFVDILPAPWTAVSLCLSEDCNDLYIARYCSRVAPLILKLPFSRHKLDDEDCDDESSFDYHKGKAELQEIIDLSNYSCHNPGSIDAKGAKTKWWKKREDLDRRLHELLVNIENIWFGGFKAIFSQHRAQNDALVRFRASFDQILTRHLPSRRTGRGKTGNLEVDNQVLELLIGLETVRGMTSDLDEPVTDLLYFVVDLLQFKGERNAYDEIDFDSMTIDVLDALQTYHELSDSGSATSQHLILVLDRRLQAFPWESLPCLEGSSVSRVGSMLSLRDCIVSMREHNQASIGAGLPNAGEGLHTVCRNSGTYILNPSSDLAPTQALLEPCLSTLLRTQDSQWRSIVNTIPSEDEFSLALSSSSVTLYFGHGAGSQYIRPRTIKRLEQCSEVVWLMGCSSGAIWEYGDLEPCAIPLAYLLAGTKDNDRQLQSGSTGKCMSVVATLWDVTDKDIDRFALAIGEDWGLWPATGDSKIAAKTPRKREIVAQPSTPLQIPKTPKTPAARKTPAITKTPAISRSRPRHDESKKLSLVEAVARSRDACVLRYLNGAAPVVYGVPVYLGD